MLRHGECVQICSCCPSRGIRKNLGQLQVKGQHGQIVVNLGLEGMRFEKTAKFLTRDFGLNSQYCGKPVKGFYIFEKSLQNNLEKDQKRSKSRNGEIFHHGRSLLAMVLERGHYGLACSIANGCQEMWTELIISFRERMNRTCKCDWKSGWGFRKDDIQFPDLSN